MIMDNIFIVIETLNQYIVGVYSSELNALLSINDDLIEEGCVDDMDLSLSPMGDFTIFKSKLDDLLNITFDTSKYTTSIHTISGMNCEKITYESWNDIFIRIRNLKIDYIIE